MKERVIVKLGGSVITDKSDTSGDCRIRHSQLREIADHIAAHDDLDIIIIHGAGSCGHPQAKHHHLDKGLDSIYRAGIFITHQAVCHLNDALDAGIAHDGRLISYECRPVDLLIRHGIVPVLHGDVVMDQQRGACIVSGDQLVSYLPRHMQVERIGLATDVAGVLDGNRVIPRIDRKSVASISLKGSGNTDVTGGMKGKIEELLRLAEDGNESNIFHVSRLGDFLSGHDHGGTIVTR